LRTLEPGEVPLDWAQGSEHLFTESVTPTQVRINKVDWNSDRRESWLVFEPREQQCTLLNVAQVRVQPEMETSRSPLLRIPRFCRGFPEHSYDHQAIAEQGCVPQRPLPFRRARSF